MHRPSTLTLQLLEAFLRSPGEWRHGYELSASTGLRHGTIYPQLLRLEGAGILESYWEEARRGRGKLRHVYRLTESGRTEATALCAIRSRQAAPEPMVATKTQSVGAA